MSDRIDTAAERDGLNEMRKGLWDHSAFHELLKMAEQYLNALDAQDAAGYSAGYAAAMLQAAQIADSHRAINLNNGLTAAGLACSSVSAFIVQAAREKGLWDESLPQPLIKSNAEMQEDIQ